MKIYIEYTKDEIKDKVWKHLWQKSITTNLIEFFNFRNRTLHPRLINRIRIQR